MTYGFEPPTARRQVFTLSPLSHNWLAQKVTILPPLSYQDSALPLSYAPVIRYTLQVKPFREQSQQSCIHRLSLMLGLLGLPCLI